MSAPAPAHSPPVTAKLLMSSPVRTLSPTTTLDEAQNILLRYGHNGLCVVDDAATLVGMISRRDIDIAVRHGLGYMLVKDCMIVQIKSIEPDTSLAQIQSLMMTYDVGRLPVLDAGALVGIVTRTDLLRQLHQGQQNRLASGAGAGSAGIDSHQALFFLTQPPQAETLYRQLESRLGEIWPALMLVAQAAERRGWEIYVVGGCVRDLLLNMSGNAYPLTDIDLVVDGGEAGAGVALAETIRASYPQVSVQVYGEFQTAALAWDGDVPLSVDIATARTEFYPYPAANPEVEVSNIRQDLCRRDFTINAMALRLGGDRPGTLLDLFGGWVDLGQRQVRVLHANSFVEDPTRIFRAVKFAVRLGFAIDAQTKQFIRYAMGSGVYERMQVSEDKVPALRSRLKTELKYLLSTEQWEAALRQIEQLGALVCLHRQLKMTPLLWRQLRRMDRWLSQFKINQPRWLMLTALILAQLDDHTAGLAAHVATRLDLDPQSVRRLENLFQWEANLLLSLPAASRPSEIYELLKPYDDAELLLMSDRHPCTLGPPIWQYIVRLSQIPPLVKGDTLKRLGYQPGPQFRDILTAVHQRTLNGELTTLEAAKNYVLASYPLT
ncbi:MAG: CBS domain-containing protein [Phormidesmis sp.]